MVVVVMVIVVTTVELFVLLLVGREVGSAALFVCLSKEGHDKGQKASVESSSPSCTA